MYCKLFIVIFSSFIVTKVSAQCLRSNGYFAHESHCDQYYECNNGVVVREGLCSDGLVFDKRYHRKPRCVHPFGVDCRDRPQTQPPKPTNSCPRQNGFYADRQDCRRFYTCHEGRAFLLNCPPGLAYDEYTGTCNWPDLVDGCNSEQIVQFNCPEPTEAEIMEFGDPRYATNDCRKFVVCVESEKDSRRTPRLLGCEEGRVFNPETRLCDSPFNVPQCMDYYGENELLRIRPVRKINFI